MSKFLLQVGQSVRPLTDQGGGQRSHLLAEIFSPSSPLSMPMRMMLCLARIQQRYIRNFFEVVLDSDVAQNWRSRRVLGLYECSFGLLRSLSKCSDGNLYIRTNGSTYYHRTKFNTRQTLHQIRHMRGTLSKKTISQAPSYALRLKLCPLTH